MAILDDLIAQISDAELRNRISKEVGKLTSKKKYRPLAFFSIIALILLILSSAFFIPVFSAYRTTGQVDKITTLIVCGFTALAALEAFFSGLLLDTMNQKNRQDFKWS